MTSKIVTIKGRENSLDHDTNLQRVREEWDIEKNEALGFSSHDIDPYSGDEVYWRCQEYDHEFMAKVYHRVALHMRCPFCGNRELLVGFNDVKSSFRPEVFAEWHPTANFGVNPEHVLCTSNDSAYWKCLAHGHEWKQKITNRRFPSTCPVCSGSKILTGFNDLGSLPEYKDIVAEWHSTKNPRIELRKTGASFSKPIWFQCSKNPHHEWIATLKSRIFGADCVHCSTEKNIHDLKEALYAVSGFVFTSKALIMDDTRKPKLYHGPLCVFHTEGYNEDLKLVVIFDDQFHHGVSSPINSKAEQVFTEDVFKTADLVNAGYRVVRIRESSHAGKTRPITRKYLSSFLDNPHDTKNYFTLPYKSFDSTTMDDIALRVFKSNQSFFVEK